MHFKIPYCILKLKCLAGKINVPFTVILLCLAVFYNYGVLLPACTVELFTVIVLLFTGSSFPTNDCEFFLTFIIAFYM